MIIYSDGRYVTRSDVPNEDWTNGDAQYVVDDDSELAKRIMMCGRYFEPIEDKDGNLIDITPLPRPEPEPIPEQTNPVDTLTAENELLKQQITDLQLAICDIYEAVTSNGTEAGK